MLVYVSNDLSKVCHLSNPTVNSLLVSEDHGHCLAQSTEHEFLYANVQTYLLNNVLRHLIW